MLGLDHAILTHLFGPILSSKSKNYTALPLAIAGKYMLRRQDI